LLERVRVLETALGPATVEPVEVAADAVPAPLEMPHAGIVSGWARTGGTVQLDVAEQSEYPTEPVRLSVRLQVVPSSSDGDG
jgi:hypothetical protein